ncbi:hypothetical protein HK101_010663 [Irineochytrium annulatum]|nr:hypothetical protein HK101_010663 [Irineochytrium annulatum]
MPDARLAKQEHRVEPHSPNPDSEVRDADEPHENGEEDAKVKLGERERAAGDEGEEKVEGDAFWGLFGIN